jgi:hypothetical protein
MVAQLLKRLIYGRRYSKQGDRWFQDFIWKEINAREYQERINSEEYLQKEAEEEWDILQDGMGRFIDHYSGDKEKIAKNLYVQSWVLNKHISREEAYRRADANLKEAAALGWIDKEEHCGKSCDTCRNSDFYQFANSYERMAYCSEHCDWNHRAYEPRFSPANPDCAIQWGQNGVLKINPCATITTTNLGMCAEAGTELLISFKDAPSEEEFERIREQMKNPRYNIGGWLLPENVSVTIMHNWYNGIG